MESRGIGFDAQAVVDGMVVRALTAGRGQAAEYGRLRLFQIREGEDPLRRLLATACGCGLAHWRRPPVRRRPASPRFAATALIVIDGGVEPPRGEAERSARTTCCTPRVANPSLACYQARLSR